MPIVINNTDLVYFPVPKLASSSLKSAIVKYNQSSSHSISDGPTQHATYPSTIFRPWYPVQYIGRRWFCVLRDPLERFLSSYVNRVLKHNDLKHLPAETLLREGLRVDPNLEDFVCHLERYLLISPHIRHHFRPMHAYLGWFPGLYDRIFTIGQMSDLIRYVGETGVVLDVPHIQRSTRKILVDDVSPAIRSKIERYYRLDYRLYGRFLS